MLGELLGEILKEILRPIFEAVVYLTGKAILTVLSLGQLNMTFDGPSKQEVRRSKYHFFFARGKKRYLDPNLVSLTGLAAWFAVGVGLYFALRS